MNGKSEVAVILEEFLEELEQLSRELLNLENPEELKKGFEESQKKLGTLLQHLQSFSSEEQLQARSKVQEFSEQLEEKIQKLRERLNGIEEGAEVQKRRLKSIQAYHQRKIF